jgi:hypothetical protein
MSQQTEERKLDRERALDRLREAYPSGSIVSTVVTHVSRSGMQRQIRALHGLADGSVEDLSWAVARAAGWRRGDGGVVVNGCGMDMAFHLVYTLAVVLYGDGYALGQRAL